MSEEWHVKLEKLAKDNKKLNQEMLDHLRVIRRRLFWAHLVSWIKLAIIAAPIILLLIWLPPKIKLIWQDYQQFRIELSEVVDTGNPLKFLGNFLGGESE